jgi:ATP-binding cassette subfamily B protein
MSARSTRPPLGRLLHHARRHRWRMRTAALFSVLNKVFDLAPPFLIGMAVDVVVEQEASLLARFVGEDAWTQIQALGVLTVVIWVLESVFEYAYRVLWRNLAQTVQHELRIEAYSRVQDLELEWFEDRSTGGLMSVLNDDVNQLERFLDGGASDLLQVATTVLCIGTAYFLLQPTIALMAMGPMPFIVWGSVVYQRRLAPRYAAVRDDVGQLNADLAGNLGGIATIKSFTAEAREVERIRAGSERYLRSNRAAIRLSSAFAPLIRMVIVVGFTATLVYGGKLVIDDQLAPGVYAVMVFLTQRLLWPLTRLGETFDLYQRAMASTDRILDLVDTPARIVGGDRRLDAADVRGDVRFDAVDFAYRGHGPVLRGLDLAVPAGETTAIVGATGAGKSTVVKLLLRFYDPTSGAITLDGVDLRELRKGDLRAAIGFVSQDVFLFHGSVRENVAYGKPDATDDEVRAACRSAEADEFVQSLPHGYDTIVGERGQKLSGGQRQRLSLARAVLKDPPVLILDEATSSVDNETEAAIQRSLARLAVGRTTLVIAHRLSTVRHAHRIHVLDGGALAESGTHEELVAQGGLYAALWRVQSGEQELAT